MSGSRSVNGPWSRRLDERGSIAAAGDASQREARRFPAMPMRTHELHPSLVHAPARPPACRRARRPGRRAPSARSPARPAGAQRSGGRPPRRGSPPVSPAWPPRRRSTPPAPRARHDVRARHREPRHRRRRRRRSPLARRNRANLTSAASGLLAAGAATYTAYLGGELVYTHGAGVKALGGAAAEAPPLFSGAGPRRASAATRGAGSAGSLGRAYRAVTGREPVERTRARPHRRGGHGRRGAVRH